MATQARKVGAANLAFFADLVRCETRLYNQFNEELRSRHGIVTSQYEFLVFLRAHDHARATDVAAEFAIGIGAASKAVDRLEARGLVTRQPNPLNRRSAILRLTDEGRELAELADHTFRTRLAELLSAALSDDDVMTVAAVLGRLRADLERRGLGVPAG